MQVRQYLNVIGLYGTFVMAFQCVWEAKDGMFVAAMSGISGKAQEASKEDGY